MKRLQVCELNLLLLVALGGCTLPPISTPVSVSFPAPTATSTPSYRCDILSSTQTVQADPGNGSNVTFSFHTNCMGRPKLSLYAGTTLIGSYVIPEITTDQASLTWMNLPNQKTYTYFWQMFDENSNLLSQGSQRQFYVP